MARSRHFLILLLIFLIGVPARAVTTLGDLRSALRELVEFVAKEPPNDPLSRELSEKTVRLRHRLRDYAIGSIVDATRRTVSRDEVLTLARRRIREAEMPLQAPGKPASADTSPAARIEIFPVPNAPDWIGVQTAIALPCGGDHALYFLRVQTLFDGKLEASLAFAKESPLESVADLSGNFGAQVTMTATGEALRVATVESAGGCSSLWRPARMRVFETDEHPYRPLRLFERERLAFLGDSLVPRVSLSAEGFLFEYKTLFWLDSNRHSRREAIRLANTEQGVRLLPPSSGSPLEFVDEWVTTPWSEAQQWTLGASLTNIRKWHEELAGKRDSRLQTALIDSGACSDRQEFWVQLQAGEDANRMRNVYGLLRLNEGSYRVEQFTPVLPESCHAARGPGSQP